MTREEIINEIKCLLSELNNGEDAVSYLTQNDVKWLNENIKALEQEPTTKNDLGVDCISRFEVTEILNSEYDIDKMLDRVDELPSVTPQEPRCKDCKWWKDSDGEYRRGCGAESKCPINTKTVYLGKGYCYKFEPQESEDKK